MRRLKILAWHIHGSYLNALARIEHDWYLPVKRGSPEGYGGRNGFDLPPWVKEVPADRVRDLDLDLVVYQTPRNLLVDGPELFGEAQLELPGIFLEHNCPRPYPVDSRHPAADTDLLLIHVTHFNRLMWENGSARTKVIEHSVAIDPEIRYGGTIARGISVVNSLQQRSRLTGYDVFLRASEHVPLDLAGMGSEQIGGLGDIPYRELHRRVAEYRFLFSPIRYTSLPLAVIEAMTIGCPVVALATTELPTVIENDVSGYVSCDLDALIDRMRALLDDPALARKLGENAREVALRRFGLERFARDWNSAFFDALSSRQSTSTRAVPFERATAVGSAGDG
jgi:glycosyltransferase involved in cell wall biosynthesis